MKVDQELLKMGQRLQIVFQTKKDTCFLLRSKLHLPIIMAENGADHSHLLPSPVTISLERNDRFFLKTRLKKDTHKHPRRPPRRSFATRPESKIDSSNNGLIMEFLNKCTGVCRADWQDRGSGEVGRGHQGSHDDDGEGESCLNETRNSHMIWHLCELRIPICYICDIRANVTLVLGSNAMYCNRAS